MKRVTGAVVTMVLLGAGVFLAAASYEVTSLGSSLARMVRDLRVAPSPPTATDRRLAPERDRPPAQGTSGEARYTSLSFTATEEDLGRTLHRRDVRLAGGLTQTRDASCRLTVGHIAIESRNRLWLLGLPVASYAGFSDWTLAVRPAGVGVKLGQLRVGGIPVPGASWLLRRLGTGEGEWVVLPTGSRAIVDRIEVADGKLTVVGRFRRTGAAQAPPTQSQR